MGRARNSRMAILIFVSLFLAGCAGIPVREAVKVDMSVPVGKIEGSQFTGIRYPFKVSAPPNWQVTTIYPEFMLKLGFEKEGLEESQVFLFNPATESNVQIELSPAGRHITFDQEKIEWLTTAAAGSLESELEKEHGRKVQLEISPTKPYSLKGVPFAAKKYTTYTLNGVKREQGWIYAFAEPYQIFIIYIIVERKGVEDRAAIKEILDSFEYVPKK
jgi:hypothetical protein